MKYLIAIFMVLITGCSMIGSSNPSSSIVSERTLTNGIVEKVTVKLLAPEYGLDGSTLSMNDGAISIGIGASQKAKDIENAKGTSSRMKIIYGGLSLIMLLSVLALFLPEWIVSNKDALIGIAASVAMFMGVKFVESSAAIMGIVIPIASVGCVIYLIWLWRKGKSNKIATATKE